MDKLTNSNIERQNILNNRYAIEKIQKFIGIVWCAPSSPCFSSC